MRVRIIVPAMLFTAMLSAPFLAAINQNCRRRYHCRA